MALAIPMTILMIIINTALIGGGIYLFILLVKALRKYLNSKETRQERSCARKSLGEALKAERERCKMTQEFVAEHLGISTRYLSSLFSRHLGLPPIQYINREKIATVAELLLSRGMSLEAAGRSVGFEDVRYLRTLFRRCMGMTATEYKAQQKAQEES